MVPATFWPSMPSRVVVALTLTSVFCAFDPSVTADVARATREGTSMGAVAARAAGLAVELIDAGIDCYRGDLVTTDALDQRTYAALLALGRDRGRALAGDGPVALGEVGVGNTTVAAALAAALLPAALAFARPVRRT